MSAPFKKIHQYSVGIKEEKNLFDEKNFHNNL